MAQYNMTMAGTVVKIHGRQCELSLHSFVFFFLFLLMKKLTLIEITFTLCNLFFLESSFSASVVLKLQSRQLNTLIYRAHSTDFSS